ncbi:30S ribosomal protein S4 [Posidoniimonas polymericola]|uniref:Small ribosomal subunit protein uS4 n=1 Tax=Posidoniimonas polymericola TaxID=2528002 RepID=A0A5C5YEA9_9BACT|nr:30S ribosomal protein S4 [Posidoniimonas polymericola]TWT73680.1 30S ribosomal protein S4 [Posidoniimonas polymericola]
MARYTGPACRLCRRDGLKLFLKGTRCDTSKCAFERRDTPPGQVHGRRPKVTDYGVHLREKQKVKHYYGVLEKQFRRYFAKAERAKGNTGDVLMSLLERRLDNVVHRLGFGSSRAQARQMINHGHITVNGRRVTIASYEVRAGDVVRVMNKAKSLDYIRGAQAESDRSVPDYLAVTESVIPEGIIGRLPGPEDVSVPVQTQLIVELCSR